jgi:hypothetical protein
MLPPESLQALDGTARGDTPLAGSLRSSCRPRRSGVGCFEKSCAAGKLDLVSACSVLDSIVIYESARYVTQCQILRAKIAFSSRIKLHLVTG